MKIKSIQFYDYRVFYAESEADKKDYFINIDSKNLLIFGENGSGKTSFFRGLRDIIHQEDFTSHFKTPILYDGYLEITFDDGSIDKFDASGSKATKPELVNTSKLNSFLSYKELLRTHLDYDDVDEINYFKIIVNDILKEHKLKTLGNLESAWNNLINRNIAEEIEIVNNSVPAEITEEEAKEQIEILKDNYENQINKFNDEFDELLKSINEDIGNIAKYFNQGISIKFELDKLTKENLSKPNLNAKVDYAASKLPSHHKFLNEARLSAIAISIYLSAAQKNPTAGAMKFLFLDDIFLGLDLSNRLPLLDILKDKFSDWQIFLTTYDRHWFEVAKQYLETSKWESIEMYATNIEGKDFEKPIILQSENHYSKAQIYFKIGDYPASLNYLRKELESLIKERLPEESTRSYEGKPHQLVHLWELLVERYERNNQSNLITEKIKSELKITRFSLLNPQSHDNLSAPVYKYELLRAFELIKDIQAIPKIKGITLLAAGMDLIFKHPDLDYSMTLELLEDWKIGIVGTVMTHDYPLCKLKHWQFNKKPFYNTHKNIDGKEPEIPIEKRYDVVRSDLISQKILQPLSENIFNANTSFENIWNVKELLEKCENQKDGNWFSRLFRKFKD